MEKSAQTWNCFKCGNEYIEQPNDRFSKHLEDYVKFAGLCGENCLNSYPVKDRHKLSVKWLLEGEGMKLKYNGTNVV